MNIYPSWRLRSIKCTKFRAPKMALLELLDSPKLISRKIWMTEKSWNFHTVYGWPIDEKFYSPFSYFIEMDSLFVTSQNIISLLRLADLWPSIKHSFIFRSFSWEKCHKIFMYWHIMTYYPITCNKPITIP